MHSVLVTTHSEKITHFEKNQNESKQNIFIFFSKFVTNALWRFSKCLIKTAILLKWFQFSGNKSLKKIEF